MGGENEKVSVLFQLNLDNVAAAGYHNGAGKNIEIQPDLGSERLEKRSRVRS
jgi:hypothetical protein